MKNIAQFFVCFCLLLGCTIYPTNISAHPGNTASDGCHYCRTNCDKWGVAWDERHCHSGGESVQLPLYIAPTPISTPSPTKVPTPKPTASTTQTPTFTPTPTWTSDVQGAVTENKPGATSNTTPTNDSWIGTLALMGVAGWGAYQYGSHKKKTEINLEENKEDKEH